MAVSIENRIATLEARLLPANVEHATAIITIVGRSGQTDVIDIYKDSDGHALERKPGEDSEAFEERAKQWVWEEYPPADPRSMCALVADNSERASAR